MHLINTVGDFCEDPTVAPCNKLIDFLTENFKWIRQEITEHPDDPYWHQVNLVFAQFYGLYHGYYNLTATSVQKRSVFDLMIDDMKPYMKLL